MNSIMNIFRRLPDKLNKAIIIFLLVVLYVAVALWIKRLVIELKLIEKNKISYDTAKLAKVQVTLEKDINLLSRKLDAKTPGSYYLVINSSLNEFALYKGKQLIQKDKCSTGSYILLKNGEHQQWMFKTPKGEFRIQGKTTSPVWKKPDWAFIEEGLPVPSLNHYSRYEYGVLGDYALNLGHGYLIHGTLYQRFLGLPVTHGCIRLNDENLELVYKSLQVGSKVFIY